MIYLIIIVPLIGLYPVMAFDTMAECREHLIEYGYRGGCVRQENMKEFMERAYKKAGRKATSPPAPPHL